MLRFWASGIVGQASTATVERGKFLHTYRLAVYNPVSVSIEENLLFQAHLLIPILRQPAFLPQAPPNSSTR